METSRHKKKGRRQQKLVKEKNKTTTTIVEPLRFTVVRKSAGAAGKDGGTVGGARQLLLPALAPNKNTWFQLFHPIKCCKKEGEGGIGAGSQQLPPPPTPAQCNPGHQHCWLKQKGGVGAGGGGGGSFTQELDGRQLLDHLGKSSLIGRAQWVGG